MNNQVINTNEAPAAIGPYSQAIKAGNMLFISGQGSFNPKTMEIVDGDVKAQTSQALENIGAILKEAGADFSNIVKTTVFIKDMEDFSEINEVYVEYFGEHKPARSCVEVARLPKDIKVEIELIVVL